MKIKEIYDFENNRQFTSDKYTIRFIREGTWWRAYEWSAYLAHNFPNGMDDSKRLFVTKKHYVELGKDLVVVGLQLKSFEKYLPCIITDDSCFSFENDYVDVNADKFFETIGNEIVDCKKVLEDWKCSFQLSEKKGKVSKNASKENDSDWCKNEIARILNEIADYQLSNRTIVENTVFLNEIQSKIKKILQ